jgi:salicylate hydroxylase
MLAKAKDVKLWKLLFRAPLPTWHRGKLVIIGDAAHPMLPRMFSPPSQSIFFAIIFSNL